MYVLNYCGYDVVLHQRDINYTMVSDVRELVHPGEVRKAKVREFIPEEGVFKALNERNNAASV